MDHNIGNHQCKVVHMQEDRVLIFINLEEEIPMSEGIVSARGDSRCHIFPPFLRWDRAMEMWTAGV